MRDQEVRQQVLGYSVAALYSRNEVVKRRTLTLCRWRHL